MLDLGQTYSELISNRRRTLGWSQQKLASKAGVSVPALQILEGGRGNPSWSTLNAVARAVGLQWEVRPAVLDPARLAELGVPIEGPVAQASERRAKPARELRPTREMWIDSISLQLAALSSSGSLESLDPRVREALAALLVAVRDHYPSAYRPLAKIEGVEALIGHPSDRARRIKLRRLALANLAGVL